MADQPKVQQNFNAPVTGVSGNVEGDMIVYAPDPTQTAAEQQLQTVVSKLRQTYPNDTDAQLFQRLIEGFEAMPRQNPQNWQRWRDIFSLLFAGGIEATKVLVPVAGIPIEVSRRLYEIYERDRKQLSDN
ncbi:hypothetical protein [Nodosilinea sp. P-1105]|uniref:hypothetical protein n=1 Tax=Nodosilinea sp. P-1105 TaxID=2546229 RepID=UPI00146B475B|nr:hypothetical protein [Nodosilinea sp. P-1105]NMF85816.1 hypothetical protein [Nodosilinea sp. P-1105]